MSLTTLTLVHNHLGIAASDTSQDAALTQWIGAASSAIRTHVGDYLYGAIGGATAADPTVITCPQHGLETGQTISISGSGTTPSLNGLQTVTVLSPDTLTVPVNVTTADTTGQGVFVRGYTEYYSGNGTNELLLKHIPVQSITNVWLDPAGYYGNPSGAFASSTLLTEGVDYVLDRDDASESDQSRSGMLIKIGGTIWPRPAARTLGLLTLTRTNPHGNIKVQYVGGYSRLLGDVVLATNQLVAQLRSNAVDGGPLGREQYDYYSYQRIAADLESGAMGSVKQLLKRYKHWTM